VLGKLRTGAAGVTMNRLEKGLAFAYAFFPGWQYWASADHTGGGRLPLGWGREERDAAIAPARFAHVDRPVAVDREVVEACRLESARGIAIVLLNWTGAPIESLAVTVPRAKHFRNVRSAERGPLAAATKGDGIEVTLPLTDVDVLMLE
jgi:hypothetical protein